MKIKTVNYVHSGIALELVAETEVEYMVLKEIWNHGAMTRGNGHSVAPGDMATGFFLGTKPPKGDGG